MGKISLIDNFWVVYCPQVNSYFYLNNPVYLCFICPKTFCSFLLFIVGVLKTQTPILSEKDQYLLE
jgi:hypothetical protein